MQISFQEQHEMEEGAARMNNADMLSLASDSKSLGRSRKRGQCITRLQNILVVSAMHL